MKNLFKYIVPMAVAVMSLAACNKEIKTPEPENALHITVKAVQEAINTETPKADAPTRTYIDGTAIKWGTGEYMKIGVYDGTATRFGNSTDASADLWDGDAAAMFEFSITPANASGSYTYYGLYPASAAVASDNTNPVTYKVNLPATQSATASSYDPKAYILVARAESGKTEYEADWDAAFRRATALNHITLTNVPEDVKRVTITAPNGTYLAGARHIDLTTGASGDIYNGGGRTETVEVRYATKLSHESAMNIWFTSWDASIAVGDVLTIVAYSSDHTYTRAITVVNKPITFKEGYLNTLNVNMASAIEGDNSEFEDGDYLVLAKNSDTYYALKGEANGTRIASVDYTGSLVSYNGDGDIVWSIAKSGDSYTFKNGSNYLGWTSGNAADLVDEASYSDEVCLMDITANAETYLVSVHNDSSRKLARNNSNEYFAFYAGSQYKDIVFVPATVDNRTVVTLTFAESSIAKTTANYNEFTGQTATAAPNVSAITSSITYAISGDAIGTITPASGAVVLNGTQGSATVTASFAGDSNYRAAEASYTIVVSAAGGPSYELVSAANDVVAGDYIITWDNTYYLPSGSESGTNPAVGTGITVANNKITCAVTSDMVWTFTGDNTNGFTISDGENILHSTNAAQGISINTTSTRKWTASVDGTYGMLLSGDDGGTRNLAVYNGATWRYYSTGGNYSGVLRLYKLADNRQEPGMSWSAASATATYNTGNSLSFSAPSLTEGNATGITYNSSDETIATINASGVVTITALSGNNVKVGSTTISAIFAGDATYKAQTVTYTLSVVDNRTAVATPGFSPAAGEVAANTVVSFTCSDADVTYYYTTNGSDPTTESASAASVTIDAAKTVKVIATKTGYKPSDVASAAYTIQGVAANDGSLEHPYTVAEALAIIAGYSDKDKSDTEVYVSGIIANVGSYNGTYHSVTYDISDDGANANTLNIYSGKFVANTNFTSNAQIAVDDEVIVYGYLYLYGTTKEMYQNNYIYSLNGTTKALTAGSLTATPDNANKQIAVTWGAATGSSQPISYYVTCGAQNYEANAAGSHTFTMADYGTYDVTVVASASDAFSATASTSATLMEQGGSETITSGTFSGSTTSISMTTASGITISQLKDDGTNVNTSYNTVSTLRVYRANQMSFSGKTFTKIEMYYTGSYSGASWTVVSGGGTVSIDTSNKKVVWQNNSGATSVALKNSTTSGTNTQLRTTQFYFEYE